VVEQVSECERNPTTGASLSSAGLLPLTLPADISRSCSHRLCLYVRALVPLLLVADAVSADGGVEV
jgi:hypothetical protein